MADDGRALTLGDARLGTAIPRMGVTLPQTDVECGLIDMKPLTLLSRTNDDNRKLPS